MHLPKLAGLALCLLALPQAGSAAERFRTDINPALLYYQAFALTPDLPEEDRRYLFSTEWRGRPIDARYEELIAKYAGQFQLVRQAAKSSVACDWGVDLTQGPDTLLPGLAKAKAVALAARLRVNWHLQHGRQDEARDELLAAFALARRTGTDGVVIGALVQFAMENILASVVAENLFRFSPETLAQLSAGFEASPAGITVQQCIVVEKSAFFDWFPAKLREIQAETPGGEAAVLAKWRALFVHLFGEEGQSGEAQADALIKASGGTTAGVLAQFKDLEPLFGDLSTLLGLPYEQYDTEAGKFSAMLAKHHNPLAQTFLAAIPKSRAKEFGAQVKLAMVQAAIAYRRNGEDGLRKVADPCGAGPFRLEPFSVDGKDRGFLLKSKLNTRGFDEVLVFATDAAPAVYVDGAKAGQVIPKAPTGR
jgi:hypothetical protein